MYSAEIELEKRITESATARYQADVQKAKKDNNLGNTPSATRLISLAIEPFIKSIEGYLANYAAGHAVKTTNAAKILTRIGDIPAIAYITTKVIFNCFGSEQTCVSVYKAISTALEQEEAAKRFKNENSDYYESIKKDLTQRGAKAGRIRTVTKIMFEKRFGFHFDGWTITEKVQVGSILATLFIEATGLAEFEDRYKQKKHLRYIIPASETVKLLSDLDSKLELLAPILLPMVAPPKDWISPFEGGYLSPYLKRNKLVKTNSKEYLYKIANKNKELEGVYSAINYLQSPAWRINTKVLNVYLALWEKGNAIAGLPNREDEEPPAFPYPELTENDIRTEAMIVKIKEWKRIAYEIRKKNVKQRSIRIATAQILRIAKQFEAYERIYFPHSADFRFRCYPLPVMLNPQGTDLAKGLLLFAEGQNINNNPKAIEWLEIQGANVWGYDKVNYSERIKFIHSKKEEIISIAENPLSNTAWTEADKPAQFLAFCFEYKEFLQNPITFKTHLPIQLDGTANGLQHYAALLRDKVAGQAVNLINGDKPADIYATVADKLINKLEEIKNVSSINSNSQYNNGSIKHSFISDNDRFLASRWLEIGINRKLTKRPVMVLPYGATQFSCREYVADYLKENYSTDYLWKFFNTGKSPSDCIFKVTSWLSKHLWEAIEQTVQSAITGMEYLKSIARIVVKHSDYIEWHTPAGSIIHQEYKTRKKKMIRTELFGSIIKVTANIDTDEQDKARQITGAAVNLIHSLDAACLMIYLNKCKQAGIKSIGSVHDCYMTLAGDTELSSKLLREAFIELYQNPILENYLADMKKLIPDSEELPKLPPKGDLDITEVKSSKYFFN